MTELEQTVLLDDRDNVRIITMNRPAARNALGGSLVEALHDALRTADADSAVGAIVLTGADPAFCAGLDLKEAARDGMNYFANFQAHSPITAAADLATPIVAAINGAAFTGGLELALACDFMIASDRAFFGDTHAKVGILPGGGMTARLPQLVGAGMARRMSMTGEVITASRAEKIGLVTEVVPHEQLVDHATALALQIADTPPAIANSLKLIYTRGTLGVIGPGLDAERDIASAQPVQPENLGDSFTSVTNRNKRQLRTN